MTPLDEAFLVEDLNGEKKGFSVLRKGAWQFLAFEPASESAPGGRFWLSDGAGLRAFRLPRR